MTWRRRRSGNEKCKKREIGGRKVKGSLREWGEAGERGR